MPMTPAEVAAYRNGLEAAAAEVDRLRDRIRWMEMSAADIAAAIRGLSAQDEAELDRLRSALRELEEANDALAAVRPQAAYNAMIAAGNADALSALDDARRKARTTLGDAA